MKSCVIKGDRPWLTTQALPSTDEHIRALRKEFTGQSEIGFYHAALIVKIRREEELSDALIAFRDLWNKHGLYLLAQINTRWVISALDTFVDHGRADESASAIAIVVFFNMLKLAETEYRLVGCPGYDAGKIEDNKNEYIMLWDGVRAFNLADDNTFANMVLRLQKVLAPMPLFELIFQSLLNKAATANTLLNRMAEHHIRHLL